MTAALTEQRFMARKKLEAVDKPVGPLLFKNFVRLGYGSMVVRAADIAEQVTKKTGKRISRQRISAITNAVRVEPETIELIAKGLGVKKEELLRDD